MAGMLPNMNDSQPYLAGVVAVFEAAGLEKTAINRWLAGKVGLGVGTGIDKITGEDVPMPELAALAEPALAEPELALLPETIEAPAKPDPNDGIIDTREEVEEAVVRAVLEVAGRGTEL